MATIKTASIQPTRLGAGSQAVNGGTPRQTGYRVNTPLPDLYSTSSIVEAMKVFVPPDMFLQRSFFGVERYFEGKFLGVDVKRMRRVLSPVVSRWHPGVTVKRPAVETRVYDVPKLAPVRVTSLSDLDLRPPGQVAMNPTWDASDAFADHIGDNVLRSTAVR